MKVFLTHLLPLILAVAFLIEGVHYSAKLANQPNDVAVFGGVALFLLTICLFVGFTLHFLNRLNRLSK